MKRTDESHTKRRDAWCCRRQLAASTDDDALALETVDAALELRRRRAELEAQDAAVGLLAQLGDRLDAHVLERVAEAALQVRLRGSVAARESLGRTMNWCRLPFSLTKPLTPCATRVLALSPMK